ncbi:hypothetical protein [Streptomyces sp. NPDC057280]|uniref:hypothetical protein n=1 Tax=Streptomyces sp. NPDC057280 TaxID=3346081 RepID=UPI003640A82D
MSEALPVPRLVPSLRDWTRAVVEARRPQESAAFDTLIDPYLTPRGRLRRERGSDDSALGSGVDTALGLLTPIAVLVCAAARDALIGTVQDEVAGRVSRLLRRARHRGGAEEADTSVALTVETLAVVRDAALRAARSAGLDETEAHALTDAVTGALLNPER